MGERDLGRADAIERLLTVDAVVAGYREPIVGPVSFVVDCGEIVGLAGPNGSGKTTLLDAVIGTANVFSGRIERRLGLRVAVQAQHPTRLQEMPLTGRELLRVMGAHRHDVPAELAPLLRVRLDRLAGGQYQLLHVWTCLSSPADLVILDEPTNNMDLHAVETLGALLVAGREHCRGVLVVSHDRALLDSVCSRVVEIRS
jgi:zinc transport system ATP-binding protein